MSTIIFPKEKKFSIYRELHFQCNHFNKIFFLTDSKWLWGPITQLWGNQQSPVGLQSFLQRCVNNADGITLWAAMAELTPTPLDVMFKPSGSLREMADLINRNITRWFSNLWWQKSNIVATDFFLGNNLIDIAVAANLRKAKMNG